MRPEKGASFFLFRGFGRMEERKDEKIANIVVKDGDSEGVVRSD
ncbi:hypothetical protein NX023_02425 [Cytobacillus firmus]|nr:hypothetical protein [Cytobacillus firmus]